MTDKVIYRKIGQSGKVIGESHAHATLTDHDVDLVLALIDEGLSYSSIAEKFEVSKSCIAHIATGRRRCQWPERIIRVSVTMDRGKRRL